MIVARTVIVDLTGNSYVFPQEASDVIGPNTLSLTRGGVNLLMPGGTGKILDFYDVVEVSGSAQAGLNRLWRINSHTATTADIIEFDGSAATFFNESGNPDLKVTFYRLTHIMGGVGGGTEIIANSDHIIDSLGGGIPSFGTEKDVIVSPIVPATTPVYQQQQALLAGTTLQLMANGDLYTDGMIRALNGARVSSTSGYSFLDPLNVWKTIHPFEGNPVGTNWTKTGGGTGTTSAWQNIGGVSEALVFEIEMPHGASLNLVEVLISNASGNAFFYLDRISHDFVTPAVGAVVPLTNDNAGGSGTPHVLQCSGGPYTKDDDNELFRAVIYPAPGVTTTVHALRYQIRLPIGVPMLP